MENPYSDKMMPETGETLDAMQLRVYANTVWDEGNIAGKAEQAEIVSGLVEALQRYISYGNATTITLGRGAWEQARKAIVKAKG